MDKPEKVGAAAALGYASQPGFVTTDPRLGDARAHAWEDLSRKCGVEAAYFTGSVPLVAFVDVDSDLGVSTVHRRLWNYGKVPLLIATTPERVLAINCTRAPAESQNAPVLQAVHRDQSVDEILADFSRFNVESGRTMRQYAGEFQSKDRVDRSLLRSLRTLRDVLQAHEESRAKVASVLGRSILVRYLEDRGILTAEHVNELGGDQSYVRTLRRGSDAVRELFANLRERFNGDIFGDQHLFDSLPESVFLELAEFFEGTDLDSGQRSFWPYDFSIIPAELISSIYEQLLDETQAQDAAYYTPRSIVDLALDEVLPWDAACTPCSLLDPSCGSGIFLAESFRRLVRKGAPGSFDELSALLTSSIFGVDINRTAVEVAAFSLYLALLEHADPPTIWAEGRLPNLIGTNLIVADFFSDHALSRRTFDVVVGNPPWMSQLSPEATRYLESATRAVPDKQIATAFLWRAADLLKPTGSMALILPSKTLIHNRSGTATRLRRALTERMTIETIVDLSPLRKNVFSGATAPAALAVFSAGGRDGDGRFVYASPRATPLSLAIDAIEISQENIHSLRQVTFHETGGLKPFLWGGEIDALLITHLRRSFRSLESWAKARGWTSGQGLQRGGGDKRDASSLVGLPLVASEDVGMLDVAWSNRVLETRTVHRLRNPAIFSAPHVAMPKGFGQRPRAAFLDRDAVFTDSLFAISGPQSDTLTFRALATLLNSSVASYWYFMTSSSWGVEREQLHPREYMSLPIPALDDRALDALVSASEHGPARSSELRIESIDRVVAELYGLSIWDQQVISDALDTKLIEYQEQAASDGFKPTASIDEYVATLEGELSAATGLTPVISHLGHVGNYLAVACDFGPAPPNSSRQAVEELLAANLERDHAVTGSAIVSPTLVLGDGNRVTILKPDRRRSWLISSAKDDAHRVVSAIMTMPGADV